MKKKLLYLLLACTIYSCSGCGKTDNPKTNEETAAVTDAADAEATNSEVTASETADTETTSETGGIDLLLPEDTAAKEEVPAHEIEIKIEMVNTEDNIYAEDGTVLFIKTCSYPVVSIEGNAEAAAKINASIQDIIASFAADSDTILGYAQSDYQASLEGGYASFIEYSEDVSFTAARCDSNVISFIATRYSYAGGAHGSCENYCVNYAADSGREIAFDDLSDNAEQFHTDTLAYLQMLASSENYAEKFYSPETASSAELEAVLYADHTWYLSASGLVFVSDPYLLGPYAAGTIAFLIPYAELAQMNFSAQYAYQGNFIIELQDGDSYTLDINGDGSEDTICFYNENILEEETNTYTTYPHLRINNEEILTGNDTKLTETFRHYIWGGYSLYDMDQADDTIELVFCSYEDSDGEYDTYSHIYRYGKDAALTYLGSARGKVSNPLSEAYRFLP